MYPHKKVKLEYIEKNEDQLNPLLASFPQNIPKGLIEKIKNGDQISQEDE